MTVFLLMRPKHNTHDFFNKFSPLLAQDGIILTDNMNFHGLVEHPERTNNRNTKSLVRKIRAYHDF